MTWQLPSVHQASANGAWAETASKFVAENLPPGKKLAVMVVVQMQTYKLRYHSKAPGSAFIRVVKMPYRHSISRLAGLAGY
jgi:hypothetical protein